MVFRGDDDGSATKKCKVFGWFCLENSEKFGLLKSMEQRREEGWKGCGQGKKGIQTSAL